MADNMSRYYMWRSLEVGLKQDCISDKTNEFQINSLIKKLASSFGKAFWFD